MLRKIRKMLKHQEGFTLVELMIVVVILGILAGVGIQQYGRVQFSARVSAHNANVRIIEGAANMYIMVEGADAVTTGYESVEELLGEYLQSVPEPEFGEFGEDEVEEFTIQITETEGIYTVTVAPGLVNEDGDLIGE